MFFNGKGLFVAGGRKTNEGLSGCCYRCGRVTGLQCPNTGRSVCSLHMQQSIAEAQRSQGKRVA
jgi:hypothetical protein